MKKLSYLLGLLNITIPNKTATHKDSKGNRFTPANIHTEMKLNTILPTGVNTWESITPETYNQWAKEMNVAKNYTRFEVTPLSTGIVNKKKLVLDNVL